MDIVYLQSTLESSRGFLHKTRDQVSRFMKGYSEGIVFLTKNKRESIDILGTKLVDSQPRGSYFSSLSATQEIMLRHPC